MLIPRTMTATGDATTLSSGNADGPSGMRRIAYGLTGIVLFLVAVVGFGFGLFTWIGGGVIVLIIYDMVSSLATFGLGYLLLLASADGRRLLG